MIKLFRRKKRETEEEEEEINSVEEYSFPFMQKIGE